MTLSQDRYLAVFSLFAVALLGIACGRDSFTVAIGVMEASGASTDKLRETTSVTMDPTRRPGFCFIVDPPTNDPYEVYSVHYLPAVPSELTGDFRDESVDRAPKGITTKTDRVSGIRPFCFDFHPGDPVGTYTIDVFINQQRDASFELSVEAPAS